MFELKPYTRKNNSVYYNPFQTMDEFERNFFNPSFFETSLDSSRQISRTKETVTPLRRICPASRRRISTST